MSLPAFRYHPDPPATGRVIRSDARCMCCGDARGDGYAGPCTRSTNTGSASARGASPTARRMRGQPHGNRSLHRHDTEESS
ncbi:CbrC family protein [Burkholderia metallica]|uniref:CbrC family protein n=1 Tax=Burkholderia metallica TaxID=488729 RepID=UPI0018FE8ECF